MANPQWPGGHHPAYPQQAHPLAAPPTSGLQLTTSFFPLQWFLHFKQPRLEINGQDQVISWGTSFVPLPPGRYEMRIYVPGLLFPSFDTTAPLMVYPNYVTGYSWDTTILTFMSGNLRELGYKPYGT